MLDIIYIYTYLNIFMYILKIYIKIILTCFTFIRMVGPLVAGIEPATFRLQACAPPSRPHLGGQHGHTSLFATWPSPPVPARPNPKSKLQTARLDFGFFGFRILDFGFWISDFGF